MISRDDIIVSLTASGLFRLAVDDSAGYPMRVYAEAPASLREVLLASRRFAGRPFLIYEDEVLTFAEHLDQVTALAVHLAAAGIKPGDRVALGMRNYPDWSVGFWACQAIGAVVVSLNAWWTGAELTYALDDSGASALLLDGERLERLRPTLMTLRLATLVVARRGAAGPGGTDMSAIVAARGVALPDVVIGPEDLATILYTSGTTGAPKGAMATQRNHVTNIMNSCLGTAVARVAAGLPTETGHDEPQAGMLATFPFFHIGGLSGLVVGLATGMRVASMFKWSAPLAVALVERHGLATVAGVPIVVRQLLEAAAAGASLTTMTAVASGGAPVPPDLIRRIGTQFAARAMPSAGYGLTETTSAIAVNSGLDYLNHPDSVGRAVPTADIHVVDEGGTPRAPGEVGELWVRGPNVIPGYWRKPEATAAAFGGGWFRTGDLGFHDDEGLYYVVDRIKDVIIRGGENAYCAEVEALILAQPGVLDAAVVGLPHADYGEEVAAVIQIAAGDIGDTAAILAPLVGRLARFKIPTVVRLTPDELPRTATGKVLKRELRTKFFAVERMSGDAR